jgi:hypothetical protein
MSPKEACSMMSYFAFRRRALARAFFANELLTPRQKLNSSMQTRPAPFMPFVQTLAFMHAARPLLQSGEALAPPRVFDRFRFGFDMVTAP